MADSTPSLNPWIPWICQEDPTLAIFEDVDGGSERVCRGSNPGGASMNSCHGSENSDSKGSLVCAALCCPGKVSSKKMPGDNSLSYFTLSQAESKEENVRSAHFDTSCAYVVDATIPDSRTEGLPAAMFNGHRPLHRRERWPAEFPKFSGCDLLSWI